MLRLTPNINLLMREELNASFTQGDIIAWTFRAAIDDTPINLTGANVKMTIGFQTPLPLSTQNGYIKILDAAQGRFVLNIPSDETVEFIPGTYPYDVWIEYQQSPPVETQYVTGNVTVNQSVSGFP